MFLLIVLICHPKPIGPVAGQNHRHAIRKLGDILLDPSPASCCFQSVRGIVAAMDNDAKAVANAFIKLAGRNRLTNMQLQKLVYIAHGYSLALLDEPLFRDKVYAWPYGPVVPSLYDALKKYGAGEVTEELYTETPRIRSGSKDWTIIRGIWNSYGKFSGPELSAMTHKPGTPWDETRTKGKLAEIDNETIKRYYRELLNVPGRLPETAFQPSQ